MRCAILSDIHGNLEAFEAVLKDLKRKDIQKFIFLGDIVGYGPNPQECIGLLREKFDVMIAGNHDWGATGKTEITTFNSVARHAIDWTTAQLNPEDQKFLNVLPLKKEEEGLTFVHASPVDPQDWTYIFSRHEAVRNLQAIKHALCFVGHSHIPSVFVLTEFGELFSSKNFSEIILEGKIRFLINVGSVGQPRDGSSLASYGILDLKKRIFYLRRVRYSIETTQKKIIAAGLPSILAERLARGW